MTPERSFLVTRTTSLQCWRVTRGKSDSLQVLRSCHIKQDIDRIWGNLYIVILQKKPSWLSLLYTLKRFCVFLLCCSLGVFWFSWMLKCTNVDIKGCVSANYLLFLSFSFWIPGGQVETNCHIINQTQPGLLRNWPLKHPPWAASQDGQQPFSIHSHHGRACLNKRWYAL